MDNDFKLSFGKKVSLAASIIILGCLALLIVLIFAIMLYAAPGQNKLLVLLAGAGWWFIGFLSMAGIIKLEGGYASEKERKVPITFGILGPMLLPILLEEAIKELHWQLTLHNNLGFRDRIRLILGKTK